MLSRQSRLISAAAITAIVAVCVPQQPAAKFNELQRGAISGKEAEGVAPVAVNPPGATSARHSHPGEDFGYVIEGTIVLMVDGHPPLTVHAGETFFTARGQVHNARNIGT